MVVPVAPPMEANPVAQTAPIRMPTAANASQAASRRRLRLLPRRVLEDVFTLFFLPFTAASLRPSLGIASEYRYFRPFSLPVRGSPIGHRVDPAGA